MTHGAWRQRALILQGRPVWLKVVQKPSPSRAAIALTLPAARATSTLLSARRDGGQARQNSFLLALFYPWLLGAPLVVLRALRGATGGASEWRPPLAWCQEVLRNPYAHHGGRLQLPERGPRTKGALGKFLRFAQGHNPWASCWWNHLKASAHARAMD